MDHIFSLILNSRDLPVGVFLMKPLKQLMGVGCSASGSDSNKKYVSNELIKTCRWFPIIMRFLLQNVKNVKCRYALWKYKVYTRLSV